MVGSSKILTVSYGTFSCTLEGFDEPFSTMKAIAEYFRNLAAEDRYFGAEPPTPDANMLHQIAERAIQKRVEAKVEENAVTLRQADAVAEESPLDEAETADMLNILNAGVDEPAETAAEMLAEDTAPVEAAVEEPVEETLEAFTEATAEEEVEEEDTTAIETAAEKLARLRALVAHAENGDYSEDEHAEDVNRFDEAALEAAFDTPAEEDVAQEAAAEEVEIYAPLKALIEEQASAQEVPETDEAPEEEILEEVAAEAEEDDIPAEGIAETIETPVSSIDEELAAEDDDDFDLDSLTAALSDDLDDETPEDSLETSDDTVDFSALDADFGDEPVDEEPAVEVAEIAAEAETEVVMAEEEETLPTVAEETLPQDEEPVVAEEVSETPRARVRKVRVLKARKSDVPAPAAEQDALPEVKRIASVEPTDEAAVERLMDETGDHMEGGDTRRRQDAFTHLKAAVTAARAEGDTDGDDAEKVEAEYRRDLEEAIRPSPTRAKAGLAPLVLVSEQRIDAPQDDAGRTAATLGNLALQDEEQVETEVALEEASDFAEFAERVGAVEMNDLLEAAAAYTAHVEGRSEFTRPVIMRHVESAHSAGDFSREEGLRSFGTLLRNGTIRKLKRGKFQIADDNKFADQARAVGE